MKKHILITGGILVLALLLAGAAYVGGRLLNGQGMPAGSSGAPGEMEATPAKELPQKTVDVIGDFDHRQDNSIFVGTGNVTVDVQQDRSGQAQTASNYDGPIVEVVVTSQTIIYEDVTSQQFNGPPPEGQQIQQVVEPGSLDEIGQNSMIAGIVALALLLARAAFVGGRLLNGQGLEGPPGLFSGGGDGKPVVIRLDDVQPAKELSQTPADMSGMFDHRQGRSVFVGTGKMTMIAQPDGAPKRKPSGPIVEVVVTSQTIIYTDVTILQFDGSPPEGQEIEQVLEPGSLDEIGEHSKVMVWGKKTGDRYIADVLVYTPANLRR